MSKASASRAGAVLGVVSLAALALTGVATAGSAHAASVANPYSPAAGHYYRHGVLPTIGTWQKMKSYASAHPSVAAATGPQTLSFGGTSTEGGSVESGHSKVYLVFYGSQWAPPPPTPTAT